MYDDNLSESNHYGGYGKSAERAAQEAQERAVRLGALCRVYEQADRVLTGDPVQVHVVNEGEAPAWSDGSDIYINSELISDFDIDELIQINGLNYHELAHHLYSPRKGTTIMQWVIEQDRQNYGYLNAANILEDQRIETLLTARYPAIVPYLTSTVIRWLFDNHKSMVGNYAAIRGRQYLPLELRIAFRDQFIMPELIPVIADIVDEYRMLAFPRDYSRAQELIQRFKEEVLDPLGANNRPDGGPNDCGDRDPTKKGRPEPGKAQIRDSERAKGMGQKEPVYNTDKPKDEQSDGGQGSDTSDKQSGSNTNNKPIFGSGSNDSSNDYEYIPESQEEALAMRKTEDKRHGYGSGHIKSVGGIPENITAIMEEIENSIKSRRDVQQDIKTKQKVIIGGDGKYQDALTRGKFTTIPVPDTVLMASRRFARELERLKQDLEPGWERAQSSGRINVQRVIGGCEVDEAFDRWDEGGTGTDMEVVLLVDRSGSMGYSSNDMRASEAAWVIKRSLEQIDVPVTIYAFDNRTELVYSRDQKADRIAFPFIYGNGGTDPQNSLLASERLFSSSKHKNKILFLITDGEFDNKPNDDIIKRLNANNVLTVLVMLASDSEIESMERRHQDNPSKMWHECAVHGVLRTAADLIPFAKPIVMNAIRMAGRH